MALLAVVLLIMAASCEKRERADMQPEAGSSLPVEKDEPESEPEPPEEETESLPDADTAEVEAAVCGFLDALRYGDRALVSQYVDYAELLQLAEGQSDDALLAIAAMLRYEALDATADEASGRVTVKLTNIDMHQVLGEYKKQAMDLEYNNALSENRLDGDELEAEYNRLLEDILKENTDHTYEKTVDIVLENVSGKWSIQLSDSLREGIFGDYWNANSQVGQNAGAGVR